MAYVFLILILLTLYVRPGDLNPGLNGIPILPGLCAGFVVSLCLSWAARTNRPRWAPTLNWLLLAWGAIVFSQIGHAYLHMTIQAIKDFLINVFVACAIVFVLNNERKIRGFATVWIWAAAFLAVSGVVQHFTGVGLGGQLMNKGRIQGVGIFADPNDLALTFLVAVPLAHARYFAKGGGGRLLFFIVTALFVYATFLTESRGGILAMGLVFVLLSIRRVGRGAGVVFAILFLVAIMLKGPSRINEIDSKEASAQGRVAAWSDGLQMFKKNPLIGVGYGLFTNYHEITAHNSFVLSFAETGFLGAYFWVGLLYVCLLSLRKLVVASRAPPEDTWMFHWAQDTKTAMWALLAGLFFLSRTYNVLIYLLIGFATALWRTGVDRRGEATVSINGKDHVAIFAIVSGGIVMTYVLVKALAIWTGQFH
jgi:putative inorganic carbon (hco3(-)) transporter